MRKKVILIHPPSRYLLIPKWTIPLTLLFLRSFLISKGYDAQILDLADAKEDYLSRIPLDAYAYGVTMYTPQDQLAKDISFYLKERTDAILIAGGNHVSFVDVQFMTESRYDAVVRGSGETPLEKILLKEDMSQIKGITYRTADNQIVRNEMDNAVADIDIYPFPRLDGVNVKEYPGTYIQKPHSDYRVGVIFSRGCMAECAFCTSVNFYHRKMKFHGFEWIKAHIEYLAAYGVRDLEILDDNFVVHRNFKDLCLLFQQHGIQWSCMGISKHITDEKAKLMRETGCKYVALGIESGSDRLLESVHKISRVADHEKAIFFLKKYNLTVKGLLMIGLPGTTQEDVDLTIQFIRRNALDSYALSTFVPFPGTPIWNNPEKYGCEIDRSIPFSEYLILSKDLDTKLVIKNSEKVMDYRNQILQAMGEKCTLVGAMKRGQPNQGEDDFSHC